MSQANILLVLGRFNFVWLGTTRDFPKGVESLMSFGLFSGLLNWLQITIISKFSHHQLTVEKAFGPRGLLDMCIEFEFFVEKPGI